MDEYDGIWNCNGFKYEFMKYSKHFLTHQF